MRWWRTRRAAREAYRIWEVLRPGWWLVEEYEQALAEQSAMWKALHAPLERFLLEHPELDRHPEWGGWYEDALKHTREDPAYARIILRDAS